MEMTIRPRRLRSCDNLRRMVRETRVSPESLIYPLFLIEGENIKEPIPSLEGQYRYSPDRVWGEIEECLKCGVSRVLLFGIPAHKDSVGSSAWDPKGVVQQGIRAIKEKYPEMYIITDVCMCEYTDHGHCGILCDHTVDNDKTLEVLAKTALSHVQAGADMVAPSDMMDGRIAAIRDAAGSAPAFGDRRGYQMDPHNRKEAMKECALDVEEGADILMVKPALSYLDIIRECSDAFDLPMAAYSVSGEYAMIKAAGKQGLIDEHRVMCESALSIYRAGADILITYFAKELAQAMKKGELG